MRNKKSGFNCDRSAGCARDLRGTYHLPWKTADGGKNWTAIAAGMIDDSDIMSVEIDRTNCHACFCERVFGNLSQRNGGAQWTKLQGIPYASRRTQQIAQDSRDAAVWYAGTTEGLWRSGDAGENWTRMTPREVIVNAIAFAEGGQKLILGTEDGIRSSRDSGKSFCGAECRFFAPCVERVCRKMQRRQSICSRLRTRRGKICSRVWMVGRTGGERRDLA